MLLRRYPPWAESCWRSGSGPRPNRLLRESLAIWDARRPDDWNRFNTQSLLGESLLGQKKYAEAEPLLLSGYEGMRAREARLPASKKICLTEAGERIRATLRSLGQDRRGRGVASQADPASYPGQT